MVIAVCHSEPGLPSGKLVSESISKNLKMLKQACLPQAGSA